MAGYQGRKAPNVSSYIANLNAVPSAHDGADEDLNFNDSLAQFTNTEFIDFDVSGFLNTDVPEYGPEGKKSEDEAKGLDFINDPFPFTELDSYLPPTAPSYARLPDPGYPSDTASPNPFNPSPYPGQKRALPTSSPISATTPSASLEPQETPASRLAAEEDKRRRNTAASARFRVKKKQREQALEQNAKELENKTLALEQRIGQLETENEWLRGLVVEKHGGVKEDLRLRWKKGEGERSCAGGKKGVGTEAEGESA